MENKNEGNENKIILETLIVLWIKWIGMMEIKWKDYIYRCFSYYALNVDNGLRIYGEGRTQIPLSSPAMIGPLARIQDRQGLYRYKSS